MLWLIGIGLKVNHLTLEAQKILIESDKVYLESYTSKYSSGSKEELEDLIGKAVSELSRNQVEEEFDVVFEEARTKKICFTVFGNPLNATTHLQIILDAKKKGIETKTVPGLSIFEFLAFTGLDRYKFGRTTTIVFGEENYEPESFFDVIMENKKIGLHSLCLLDIKEDERMMSIKESVTILERIEEKSEKEILSDSVFIGIAGISGENEQIQAGSIEQIKNHKFTSFPQSLIVCGKLNEKEIEGLNILSELK